MKRIIVLGASGSIGRTTMDILRRKPDEFSLVAASVHSNENYLSALKDEFPQIKTTLSSEGSSQGFWDYRGQTGLLEMVRQTDADLLVHGIAGAAGLLPSWAAVESGKDIALANKETIVMGGEVFKGLVKDKERRILPVDSEHSAIFYLKHLPHCQEIILSASGGAFRDWTLEELKQATAADALKHPTWKMGKKITIDSASLANKGLEVIEAHYLFNLPPERIKVVIHRESLVHSFVRTKDNALYAQISRPNMSLPIQNALFYPEMEKLEDIFVNPWDLSMTFEKPREKQFPMLPLAYDAIEKGPSFCILYNAVNEIAVEEFLAGNIPFLGIAKITEEMLKNTESYNISTLEDILSWDELCRTKARELIKDLKWEF